MVNNYYFSLRNYTMNLR